MDHAGEALLTLPSLKGMWTSMYNSDFWRLAHFNNTLTLGSLVVSLALAVPLFFVSKVLIVQYRAHILAWVQKSRIMQLLKASKFYRLYNSLSFGSSS
jgi:uncharacterized protein (TIGR03546 family)